MADSLKESSDEGLRIQEGNRWYAVIYDGLDPVTGRERRIWHPAGVERSDAEKLATRLAAHVDGGNDDVRGLSFGAYLTTRWLPGKRCALVPARRHPRPTRPFRRRRRLLTPGSGARVRRAGSGTPRR
jgi:hypothetical protein